MPVVDPKGKTFNAQMVKGGMTANVAVRITAWEFDDDTGVSITCKVFKSTPLSKSSMVLVVVNPLIKCLERKKLNDLMMTIADADANDQEEDEPRGKKKKLGKKVNMDFEGQNSKKKSKSHNEEE